MTSYKLNIKENPTKSHRRRLVKLVEVLDKLNRIYDVVPTPTREDVNKEQRK